MPNFFKDENSQFRCQGADKKSSKSVRRHLRSRGAILIEFAISIPVLLTILYYTYDLPKYVRIKEKVEFCAYCYVNMVQNISQNRENKRITLTDLGNIIAASSLPYFGGGTSQYGGGDIQSYTHGFFPHPMLLFVKGLDNGKAKIMWIVKAMWFPPGGSAATTSASDASYHCLVNWNIGRELEPSAVCEGFSIKPGEIKMVLDYYFFSSTDTVPAAKWGLLILAPQKETVWGYFHRVVIFIPKPGLFDDNPPR